MRDPVFTRHVRTRRSHGMPQALHAPHDQAAVAEKALRLETQHEQQNEAKRQQSVIGDKPEGLGQCAEYDRADKRTADCTQTAEDEHGQPYNRFCEAKAAGRDRAHERRIETAGHTSKGGTEHKGQHLVRRDWDADRGGRLLVVPYREERDTEPRSLEISAVSYTHLRAHETRHDLV